MISITRYLLFDLLRNRVIISYTLLLLVVGVGLMGVEGQSEKGLLMLWNISLLMIPMMSLVFSATYFYNSAEFVELLLAQPIRRNQLLISLWGSLLIVLTLSFWIGVGIFCLMNPTASSVLILVTGTCLTWVFVTLAVLVAVFFREKIKGLGVVLLLWFYFELIFDSFILVVLFQFSDYPMEKPVFFLSLLNPVDLARILVLIQTDASALMGFSGALFQEWLGSSKGSLLIGAVLLFWLLIPAWLALRIFRQKDI